MLYKSINIFVTLGSSLRPQSRFAVFGFAKKANESARHADKSALARTLEPTSKKTRRVAYAKGRERQGIFQLRFLPTPPQEANALAFGYFGGAFIN